MRTQFVISIFISVFSFQAFAQEDQLLDQLLVDEQNAIEAIALYPESKRTAILEAASHPEILVRLQNLQLKTQSEFQQMIVPLDDNEQRWIYNLSRYPDLINTIAEPQRKISNKRIEALVVGYPEDVQNDAIYFNRNHYDLLMDIEYLYRVSDKTFSETLKPYPAEVQSAYRELMRLPEVMSILTSNLNTTVLLGDMYRSNPTQVKAELDSLNLVVAEQKAKELQEWQESLQNDPAALAEYEEASREFAEDQGYSVSDYNRVTDDPYTSNVSIHYIWQPYPYWFGCPWWYTYNCWYPYPYWYHWGYYYGPGNVIVFVGLPSYHFVNWYYYSHHRHRHFHHYPHLTNHMISYHEHHPKANTSVGVVTDSWIKENKEVLPKNWLDNNGRVERIKEYGKFNLDYEKANIEVTGKTITEREFLEKHQNDYPTMRPILKEKPKSTVVPKTTPHSEPIQRPKTEKTRVITRPETERQEIERAKTHHENTWQRVRTPVQRPPVMRQPTQPRVNPTVRPRVKPNVMPPQQKNRPTKTTGKGKN